MYNSMIIQQKNLLAALICISFVFFAHSWQINELQFQGKVGILCYSMASSSQYADCGLSLKFVVDNKRQPQLHAAN